MKKWQKIFLAIVLIVKILIVGVTMANAGDLYEVSWSAVAASTANVDVSTCKKNGVTISAPCDIDVENAQSVQVVFDTATVINVSTDIDLNAIMSNDCRKYQNGTTATTGIYYAVTSIGNGIIGAISGGLTPAGKCFRFRIDNNDAVNAATMDAQIYVVK